MNLFKGVQKLSRVSFPSKKNNGNYYISVTLSNTTSLKSCSHSQYGENDNQFSNMKGLLLKANKSPIMTTFSPFRQGKWRSLSLDFSKKIHYLWNPTSSSNYNGCHTFFTPFLLLLR